MAKISREQDILAEITLTNSLSTTQAIAYGAYSGSVLIVPSGYTSTTVTVYTAADEADTFLALKDSSGTAITFTVSASSAIVIPNACFACRWLKFVTNANDSAIAVTLVRKG